MRSQIEMLTEVHRLNGSSLLFAGDFGSLFWRDREILSYLVLIGVAELKDSRVDRLKWYVPLRNQKHFLCCVFLACD